MTRTNAVACGLYLIFVGIAPAAADTNTKAPGSLQMRARPGPAARLPGHPGKQVAQAPPDQPPPDGDQPPVDKAGATTPSEPAAASVDAGPPAAPTGEPAADLSDAEFAKLAE